MNNEPDAPINMTDTIARRLADLRATPAPIMNDRPADRSRNGMRIPRSPKRKIIR